MATTVRKLSDIMKEMGERLLHNPDEAHSSEATHVALFFANVAWNESVGLDHARDGYRNVWEEIEAENPQMWSEFKSNDINAMIDDLVEYKKQHFPQDRRRILTCGMPDGRNIRVEWLPPARPGVDSKWEMELYGLVRTGQRKKLSNSCGRLVASAVLRQTLRLGSLLSSSDLPSRPVLSDAPQKDRTKGLHECRR